ncbi:protein charybde [Tribolium castaneum]|uniref:Protein charybde-like Protein n=1 Tax=Tribolium castaneum TaxID=7070 RepID=D6WVR1_TRICA|nr:PREDICTED: protein charybde [Tribolium castaneum]EFA08259.1 Protein charybde-like Protein [Tribolium castaneum]|eukprot:XP_008196610.1 PREDICTED: protein charybde [Tribolium castaneum]
MLRKRLEEDKPSKSTVFSKLLVKSPDLAAKTMSSDIIESVLVDAPAPSCPVLVAPTDRGLCVTLAALTYRLERELRAAKRTHLSCGEVLLPSGLLHRIARDVLGMAESEPCGIRGCLIYVNFEGVEQCRKLASFKCDPETATTFELKLTFKQNPTGWNFIPQFLKNLATGGTIVVSPAYVLTKKKLYRSMLE